MTNSIWSFIAKPKNRQILAWLGGGLMVLAAGTWTVVTFVWPAHEAGKTVCAQQGSIAGGRDASGNTIVFSGGAAANASDVRGTASCSDSGKK